jgi:hypothetical protein
VPRSGGHSSFFQKAEHDADRNKKVISHVLWEGLYEITNPQFTSVFTFDVFYKRMYGGAG